MPHVNYIVSCKSSNGGVLHMELLSLWTLSIMDGCDYVL